MSEKGYFVNIIKPTMMTSFEVVNAVKKTLKEKKVGHLGTLDPAASGVLPIAVGKATKFFDYFLKKDKEYVALVNFGVETDTLDAFGKVLSKTTADFSIKDLQDTIKTFTGKIRQIPPRYSAVKIGGEKAYDLARKGLEIDLKPREIEIFSIEILEQKTSAQYLFKVHCSAGTYIRTLFDDIAQKLGTHATTVAIIRAKSGAFDISDAQTLDEFKANPKLHEITEVIKKPEIDVDDELAKKFINGQKVNSNLILNLPKGEFYIKNNEKVIGLYENSIEGIKTIVYLYN